MSGSPSALAQESAPSVIAPNECGLFVWVGGAEELRFLSKKDASLVFDQGESPRILRTFNRKSKDRYDLAWQQTLFDTGGFEKMGGCGLKMRLACRPAIQPKPHLMF